MFIGIDEAGRGCVIGPLVIAGLISNSQTKLKNLGARDSKLLVPSSRKKLYDLISTRYDYAVEYIYADELNDIMKRYSLNEIEAMYAAKLLDKLIPVVRQSRDNNNHDKIKVFIDSPDPVPKKFENRILKYVKSGLSDVEFIVENKADVNYPVASAASIIAKVSRDMEIERIKKEVNYDFGSGYTSDPMTTKYLKHHFLDKNIRPYIRKRWSTIDNLRQPKIFDF
ncbi:ribonuclease HII [Candidatus Micrarchaeota archaeon]|nr:ribonuclease HII [Candidatus Micrarchaeota archaeon]